MSFYDVDPKAGLNESKKIFGKFMLEYDQMAPSKVGDILGLDWEQMRELVGLLPDITDIKDCYYVAGGMSGYDHHNFPAFDSASDTLRAKRVEVVSPAELDTDEGRQNALNTIAGVDQVTQGDSKWSGFLERDLRVVAATKGTIVIDGWEQSAGAKLETFVADKLGKELIGVYPKLKPLSRKAWVKQGIVRDYE